MAEKPHISDAEKHLYETAVEEAVEEVSRVPKGKSNQAEAIIQQFLDEVDLHQGLAVKFRGEVLRKVADLKRQADNERERKILEKFEGQVVDAAGQLRFAGVDENAKFYARAGSLFRRIFGKRYNAEEADQLLREVQELEDDIEQNELQLRMLEASYEASRKVIPNMRKILKAKREGRFAVGYIDDAVASWKAASGQKKRATAEYKTEGKRKIKEIKEKSKELEKQKSIVEEIRKKVEQRRKSGREIFEQQFGQQVEILRQMTGQEQKREEARLRSDVREFGKDAGIVYMEYFLNEALNITPKTARLKVTPQGTVLQSGAYKEPLTEREAAEEMASFSRWCEFVLGKAPSKGELTKLLNYMRDEEPQMLGRALETQRAGGVSLNMLEVRFLITGVDMMGKTILDADRRMAPTSENIVRLMRYAKEHEVVAPTDLQEIFESFAKDWPDEYTAEDFGYIFDFLKENKKPPEPIRESKKEREENEQFEAAKKALETIWIRTTGESLEEDMLYSFFEELENRFNSEQIRDFFRADRQHDLMRFFYTGKFGNEAIVVDFNALYKPDDVARLVDSYEQATKILRVENPSDERMIKVLRKLQGMDEFKQNGVKALDADLFEKLLREVKDEENQAKSQPTVVVSQAQAPAPMPANPPAPPSQPDPEPAEPPQPVAPTPPSTPEPAPASDALSQTDYREYENMYDLMLGIIPSRKEIEALDDYLKSQAEDSGRDIEALRKELLESKEHHEIMGFFLSGEYNHEKIATKNFVSSTPENILKLYLLADQILNLQPKPEKSKLQQLFKRRKTAVRRLAAKSIDEIKELINKLR